jgi:hypothetical protein
LIILLTALAPIITFLLIASPVGKMVPYFSKEGPVIFDWSLHYIWSLTGALIG